MQALKELIKKIKNISTKDRKRNINVGTGNYNENIYGDYIQGDKNIINSNQVDSIQKPTIFPQNIILSRTDKFIGREQELENLNQQFKDQSTITINAIEGIGGIGKTELAIQYSLLHLQLNTYPGGICWIRCREQDIASQIISFSQTKLNKNPPEHLKTFKKKADWCWTNWQEGKTLIVLDDVKNYEDIEEYLPPQPSQFKILITTRLKLDLSNPINLEVLSKSESLELLSELIGSERVNRELETAQEICQFLGYLPLALQLVGRYIKNSRKISSEKISLAEELENLKIKRLEDPSLKTPINKKNKTINIKLGVKAAFELSWENLSNTAQELGCLLSLFALAPIPPKLVEITTEEQDIEATIAAISELENLHLLEIKKSYQFHQLIQEFFREKQENLIIADPQKSNLCKIIINTTKKIHHERINLADISELIPFIPHIIEIVTNHKNILSSSELNTIYTRLGRFYKAQGNYKKTLPWYKKSVSTCKKYFGEKNQKTATSINNIGDLYRLLERHQESESSHLQALEIRKEIFGENHSDVANSLNNLGVLYYNRGRYEKAEDCFSKALKIAEEIFGKEHAETVLYTNNLAYIYRRQREYEKAETLFINALELNKELLGMEDVFTVNSIYNLAIIYKLKKEYDKSEPLYIKALKLYKDLLVKNHPQTISCLRELASLYKEQKRYEEAEKLYLEAKELEEKH